MVTRAESSFLGVSALFVLFLILNEKVEQIGNVLCWEEKVKVMWLKIIGAAIALVGCVMLFDGRRLVKKYFDFGEENIATKGMKIIGFMVAVIGGLMMVW